ncbi:MAG: zinc-finger domain-containing protein [Piscirickettsiaceae bacterium]|nr:zinc-finger domain-containing protein [Piscirickettsiaceae bacterium]
MGKHRTLKVCSEQCYEVRHDDLPLSCPPISNVTLWDVHPRVYLDVEEMGNILCPYCGTSYILVND